MIYDYGAHLTNKQTKKMFQRNYHFRTKPNK